MNQGCSQMIVSSVLKENLALQRSLLKEGQFGHAGSTSLIYQPILKSINPTVSTSRETMESDRQHFTDHTVFWSVHNLTNISPSHSTKVHLIHLSWPFLPSLLSLSPTGCAIHTLGNYNNCSIWLTWLSQFLLTCIHRGIPALLPFTLQTHGLIPVPKPIWGEARNL